MFKGHRIIVIGDAHDSPHISQDRFKWIGKYIKQSQPDYIIQIGDWASFDSLSYFQKISLFGRCLLIQILFLCHCRRQ